MSETDPITGVWDVPRAVYHADRRCVSHSAMCDFRRSVPLFAGRWLTGAIPYGEPTSAMQLGTAFHLLTLEPQRFSGEFSVIPDHIDRRTKAGKERWAEECEIAGRKIMLRLEEFEACRIMAEAVRAHPQASAALQRPGQVEQAIRWQDDASGLWCRALTDKVIPSAGLVIDLKTTTDPTPTAFARSVFNFGYHCQAAHYLRGVHAALGLHAEFMLIAVGKEPPHEVCCYLLDAATLEFGDRENRWALEDIAARMASGDWTSRHRGVNVIGLPSWALRGAT